MRDTVRFTIAIFEIFIFSVGMISIDVIIIYSKSFDIPFFSHVDDFPLYGMNYLAIYLIIMIYRCIKIHNSTSKDHDPFQKYRAWYLWVTNEKIQKALNAFMACGILFCIAFLWNTFDFLILFACGFFFWGVLKLFQGTMEVV